MWSFECDLSKKHGEIEEVVLKIGRECAEVDFLINNVSDGVGCWVDDVLMCYGWTGWLRARRHGPFLGAGL